MKRDSTNISELLPPSESVEMNNVPERGTSQWNHGYTIDEIDGVETGSNAVVLAIEDNGSSEAVLIANDIELSVTSLKGNGYAVIANIDTLEPKVRVVELVEAEHTPLTLKKGDVYYYRAVDGPLILRDQSTPEFKDGDEITMSDAEAAYPIPKKRKRLVRKSGRKHKEKHRLVQTPGREIKLPASFWLAYNPEIASKLESSDS